MSRDSKLLCRLLSHSPEDAGLEVDVQGWCKIDELLRALKNAGRPMTRARLLEIVEHDEKQRFTICPAGRRISTAQGHSLDIDLGLSPIEPPEILYRGTASQALDAIFKEGLKPGRRRHVHLSLDQETASMVGRRHGRTVVLHVRAGQMHAMAHVFWRADNGVWLTDRVPPDFLAFSTRRTRKITGRRHHFRNVSARLCLHAWQGRCSARDQQVASRASGQHE
ncbi:MAG: RNA 2'-phosphotransferase [Parvularcula sp.]|jgi:putative RNA 2'-phosphotransferase|nr:RNA 2'-phosphotransferase [Parvularcula sp.]